MSDFQSEWQDYCKRYGEPDRVELMLCDLNAVLRGKWLPGSEIAKLTDGGVKLPLSTYAPNILGSEVEATGLGIVVGDPDGILQPVPGTLAKVPWADGHVAQVLVEMGESAGLVSDVSPREVLRRNVQALAELGLRAVVATELEFYLVQTRPEASDPPMPPERLPDAQNYDLEVLDRHSAIMDQILEAAAEQGLATDTLIAEYGPGQFEVNFHHTGDVFAAAETALLFRRLVRGVVATHGFEATFMAKPYAEHPGSGMHMHVSVLNEAGDNVFAAETGVGPRLQHAVGGVLDSMRELQAIFAPHLNSYRRFQPNSFAPATPDWGLDNRAAAVRLPETSGKGARLEHRISGADVNPYLALAAVLGGIAHGIRTKCEPPAPLDEAATSPAAPLAHDWTIAVDSLANSELAATFLGEKYRDIYVAVRRDEIAQLTTVIHPVEYAAYLSRL